jgi:hypothetical protein
MNKIRKSRGWIQLLLICLLTLILISGVNIPVESKSLHLIELTNTTKNSKETRSLTNEVITVDCNPENLIDALRLANDNPGSYTINLSQDCVYQLSTHNNINANFDLNGLPIIASTIYINGQGAILESSHENLRAFEVAPEGKLFLSGLEIRNFKSDDEGAAILNRGSLTINNSTFSKNTAIKGGAIFNLGELIIYNSTFFYNSACC